MNEVNKALYAAELGYLLERRPDDKTSEAGT